MEAFKLDKITDKKVIDIQLILQQLEIPKKELKKSLKRRKELAIKDTKNYYEEFETEGMFETINSNDTTFVELLDKNKILKEEVRGLKRKHGIQSVRLCEVTEKKKKVEEDKVVSKEDKRLMET